MSDPSRAAIVRAAVGLALYAGAFGVSYGAIATSSGLSVGQAMVLSVVMFSGGSQIAFVGVAAAGNPWLGVPTALLLAVRNAFYGVTMSQILGRLGWRRPAVAHLVIDETTAMAVGQTERPLQRFAFYVTGGILFVLWQLGSLGGAVLGSSIDPSAFGLDVAAPAAFIALVWPSLTTARARVVAAGGALLAFLLIPVAPAGVPVIAAAGVAVIGALARRRPLPPAEPLEPTTEVAS